MNNKTQTVYVVDDDTDFRVSLTRSLRMRGFKVEDFLDAETFLNYYDPEVSGCLVLDYRLPKLDGLGLQSVLNKFSVRIPIIFITGHGGVPECVKATKAGAFDFLEKPYDPKVLFSRILAAFELDLAERTRNKLSDVLQKSVDSLTARERDVFNLIVSGSDFMSNKSIASQLNLSSRTVEKHRAQILKKTACRSITELVVLFADYKPTNSHPLT